MVNLANLLNRAKGERISDAERLIADRPLACEWWRGETNLGALTVRAALTGRVAQQDRGQSSQTLTASYAVIAPAGTDLRAEDRLVAPALTFLIRFVPPVAEGGVQAIAEVLQ